MMLPFVGCNRSSPVAQGWQTSSGARAGGVEPGRASAVDSAIELSDRYAKLSDEATAMRIKNHELDTENQRLKTELKATQERFEKAQKDLNDVNNLLVEMRVELNNWKTDVLGFRGEIRDAQKAQLEALIKILKILGADVKADSLTPPEPDKTMPDSPAKEPEDKK